VIQTFAGGALDRAGILRRDPQWLARALGDPRARFAAFASLRPLCVEAGSGGLAARWLSQEERAGLVIAGEPVLLGIDAAGAPHFAISLADGQMPYGAFEELRAAAARLAGPDAAALGCGKALLDWHARHRFCAACGGPTTQREGGWKRACAHCGAEHFPRTDPVVIMMTVRTGDDGTEYALLVRQSRFPPGMYSCLAGFVEPGETLEQTLVREVKEEVGVEVTNLRYFASQPWPFPHSLMIAFYADYAGGEITPDPGEIEDAGWFTPERLPQALPGKISISRRLIDSALQELGTTT